MQPTVYILHGCPSNEESAMDSETRTYDKHWIPWIKQQLEAKGYRVITPLMPNPWTPDYHAFKAEFEKNPISENDILIGHSCGGTFLVHWLGDSKQKVAKLILIAPWKIPETEDPLQAEYYGYDIDPTIPERVNSITMFTSDDEEEDGKESVHIFHKALGGKLIELPKHGHYTLDDMSTAEFPELLEDVINP